MRCQACGKENSDRYKFCLGCGATLAALPQTPETKSRSSLPRVDPITALVAEAEDYERFEMFAEAIACLERAVAMAPKRGELKDRLRNLQALRRAGG